jgi:hypothetical protein
MKKLITIILILVSINGFTQSNCYWGKPSDYNYWKTLFNPTNKPLVSGYIMFGVGNLRENTAGGVLAGIDIKNIQLGGGYFANKYEYTTNVTLGYSLNIFNNYVSLIPKGGIMWNNSANKLPHNEFRHWVGGIQLEYHQSNWGGFIEFMGNQVSLGLKIITWDNE